MLIFNSKFGFWKQSIIAIIFLLGCHLSIYADPISGTAILISLAVSAATTAASYGAQLLFAPKPKPQTVDKNKIGALDVQSSYVGVGAAMVDLEL